MTADEIDSWGWNDPPKVNVAPLGRFWWYLTLIHGPMECGYSFAFGRRWADRRAVRMLRRYNAKQAKSAAETHEVTAP